MRNIKRCGTKRLLVVSIFSSIFLLCCASQGQEASLADQAAAAKAHSHQQTDPDVFGYSAAGDYHNEFLGFGIRHIPGWTSMSRGMMNVDEALGREALGMQAGINQSTNRVFGMHDEAGTSVTVAIVQIPEGQEMEPAAAQAALARVAKAQLPSPHIKDESVLLSDGSHRFSAVRVSYVIRDTAIFQSMQVVQLHGYAVSLTASARSEGELEGLLHQLQKSFEWESQQQGN